MNIEVGFQIESPNIFVPWKIGENELTALFVGSTLDKVANGYFTVECEALGRMRIKVGFHFTPRQSGVLTELEFFRNYHLSLEISYYEFQHHLESTFGKPSAQELGSAGFQSYAWKRETVEIVHYVFDRFGPEEHVRIKKLHQ